MGNTQQKQQNKSFLVEAGVISISSFVVKIIGVLFKIPLAHILGGGMGIFSAAYSLYAMLYMVSTSGLPVAISRLIAASDRRGRQREVQRTFRVALTAFTVVGVLATAVMMLAASWFFRVTEHQDSVLAAYIIAPTLLFVCVCSAFRGCYQGLHNMYPTAIGQLIEAVFKMGLGLGATFWARHMGYSSAVQAACAVSGITVGMLVEMGMLFVYRAVTHKRRPIGTDPGTDPIPALTKRILLIALPATITSSALYLSNFIDTVLIKRCLMLGGSAEEVAEDLYTAYTSYSTAIADLLPSTLIYPIAISILPAVSAALSVRDTAGANRHVVQSVRISAIIGLPSAAFLLATAPACLSLLYRAPLAGYERIDAMQVSSGSLRILAVGIIFMAVVSTTNALLQAVGKIWLPMISVGIGVVVMAILEYFGVSGPFGIYGAPFSSVCCYLIASSLNLFFLRRHTTASLSPVRLFFRPALCALLTGLATFGVYSGMTYLLPDGGRGTALAVLLVCGIVTVGVYVVTMLAFRGITADEVRLLPFGGKIAAFLIRKGWLHESV